MSLLYKIGNFTGRFNVLSSRNIINPIFASYLKPQSHETKHSVYFQGRLRPPADQKIKSFLGCIGNTRRYSLYVPFDHIKGTKKSSANINNILPLPRRVECGSIFHNVPKINYAVTSCNSPHLIAAAIPNKNQNSGNELNGGISSCKLSADDIGSVKAAFKPFIFSKCKTNREVKDEGIFKKILLKGFGLKNNFGSKWPRAKLDQQGQKRTFSNKMNAAAITPTRKKMSNEQRIRDKIQLDKVICGIKIKTCNSKQLVSNIYHTESRTYAWIDGNTIMSSAYSPKVRTKNASGVLQSKYTNQFKPYELDFEKSRDSIAKCDTALLKYKNSETKASHKQQNLSNAIKSDSLKKYNKTLLVTKENIDPDQTEIETLETNASIDASFEEEKSAVLEKDPQSSSPMDLNAEDVEHEENSKDICESKNSIENEEEISEYANSSITHIKMDALEEPKAAINDDSDKKVDILINNNKSRCKKISNPPIDPLTNKYFLDNIKDKFLYRGHKVRKYSTMTNYVNQNAIECRKAKNKVVTIIGNKSLQIIGKPIPNVGDYDALIKVDSVAISGSDLHIYETGGKYLQNIALGHEASGTVQKIGKCVQHLMPGDKVAIEPGVPCGICDYCRSGKYNLCPETIFNGFFAKYCVHPADFCYKLPSDFNLEDAALIQPLAEGLHACQKGNISLHTNVLIIGACPLGLSSVIFARAMGASNITIIDTQEKNLCVAQELCSDREILVREQIETETIRQILSGMTVHPDVVIDCWGCTKSMNISLISLKPGGICVLASCQEECSNCTIMQALMKELQIICSFRSANMYIPVINLISACKIDVSPMITHRFSISDANSAFKTALMDKQCKAVKVLVKCWQ